MSRSSELTAAQRRAAVTRLDDNLALRSGAGCGKTFVLARRFTELLMAGGGRDNPLSRLVALTFTDKAALEMSQRVRRFLKDAADRAKGDDRPRLLNWLERVDEARISTIHSFCASLLRSHAVAAGIDPSFAVCSDELLTAQRIADAAEQAVLQAIEQGDDGAAALAAAKPLDQLIEAVRSLVARRVSIRLDGYDDPAATLKRWEQLADEQRRQAWQQLQANEDLLRRTERLEAEAAATGQDDKLAVFIREKVARIRAILADPSAATAEDFAELAAKPGNIGAPTVWGEEAVQAARDDIKELAATVCEYAMFAEPFGPADAQAAETLATLTRLARRAERLYAATKRAAGVLDFEDLLICTEQLLRTHPQLCRTLAEGIDQVLIDECQDTDAFQVALLERLIRGGSEGGVLPAGRVFLVGDAKQSIYRFRGAQVEVFEDWCRRLGAGGQEELDVSFRTHEAGAAFVNHLFAPMMGEDYAPIRAHRRQSPPEPCAEIVLAEGIDGKPITGAPQAVAAQAAAVAERIEQMLAAKERRVWDAAGKLWRVVRAGDVAVLFARMTQSLAFERALAERHIDYYVVAGSGFFRQQEVYDVVNALRAIDNPYDDVALMGVLRSSLFGLDDEALTRIALASRPPYWPSLAAGHWPADLDAANRQALARAVATLTRLHRDKDALGPERLVTELLSATGYEATLLAQPPPRGKRMVGNVRLLLDQARAAAAEGLGLADFCQRSDELILHESRYEQAAVAGEAENVVRLMTIHKAKGLEFPVVFVPDLNFRPRGRCETLLHRSDWGLVTKLRPDAAEEDETDEENNGLADTAGAPLSYRLAAAAEDRDQDREAVRKLYVAVTRACDHVVLVGANWQTQGGEAFREKGSFLTRIDAALAVRDALAAGQKTIPYGDGRFQAALSVVTPSSRKDRRGGKSAGAKMLAAAADSADLAGKMLAAAKPTAPPPLLGPVRLQRAELAVTALVDFATCPMLYRWQHELRVPTGLLSRPDQPAAERPRRATLLDPATMGTLVHRCMEMVDFAHPPSARALVTAAACQLRLTDVGDLAGVAEEFAAMLERFRAQPLWRTLASAPTLLREVDFVLQLGPAVLRGQMDVLVQDAAGVWRIVDYKSDHVEADDVAAHAGRYELQMLAYAEAARRHTGIVPTEVVLHFLRPGAAHRLSLSEAELAGAEKRLVAVVEELLAARGNGQFTLRGGEPCAFCRYRSLCRRRGTAGA